MISVFGVMGFFVILVVIVLMIAIYGLLHIDLSLPSGDIYNSGSHEDCIQGSQVLNQGGLSDINLGTLNGTLTPYQQNLLKTLQLEGIGPCNVPKAFVNEFFKYKGLQFSLLTGNNLSAIKYFNSLINKTPNSNGTPKCGCYGT